MMEKIRMLHREWISVALVLLLTIFALLPLFKPGFFPMHDNEQVARLYDLDQTLKAGDFPPRIAPNLGFGYGYMFFNFYPYFVYALGEVFVLFGFSYIVATKIVIVLGFLAAALAMYLFVREIFGKIAGVVSAVAYTYLPYHSVDIYVRGAIPEFWSFVFPPLLVWTIYKLHKTNRNLYVILTALAIAFFIFTHNLIAFMSAPFIGLFSLFILSISHNRKEFFVKLLVSGLLGLMLSAFFWLPSFMEKQFTMIDLLTTDLANYAMHFVYIRQFWNSPWGYGGSIYGLMDGLSFQAGKIQIIFSFIAVFLVFFLWKKREQRSWLTVVFFILFLLGLFMCTFYSAFIWNAVSPLWYVQFPWRYLLFGGFAAAVLCGAAISFVTKRGNIKVLLAAGTVLLIILINKDYFVPAKYLESITDKDYTNTEMIRYTTSSLAAEYTPKGIATRKTDINTKVVAINKDEIQKTSFTIINGDLTVIVNKNLPQTKRFRVNALTNGVLQVNTFTFPGWKVFINGKETSYSDNNRLRLITLSVPKGINTIDVILTDTPVRHIANTLSIASLLSILLYTFSFLPGFLYNKRSKKS